MSIAIKQVAAIVAMFAIMAAIGIGATFFHAAERERVLRESASWAIAEIGGVKGYEEYIELRAAAWVV